MKISNSKKELARIISENEGWRDGANFAVQDNRGSSKNVWFSSFKPTRDIGSDGWRLQAGRVGKRIPCSELITNWHQTILSREEYLHLYPVPDDGVIEVDVYPAESIPEPESKPTIEQLAADYRNRKDYADRKQEEADAAKADAEVKLAELVAAGKEIGFVPILAVKSAIDGCMQLVDMVPTKLQSHQDESVAAIGYAVNVDRLYDKVRDSAELIK